MTRGYSHAHTILTVLFFACSVMTAYAVFWSQKGAIVYIPMGAITALFGLSLIWPEEWKLNLVLLTFSVATPIYLAEVVLALIPFFKTPPAASYDTRSKLQVVRDFRDGGVDAWPSIAPHLFLKTDGLPLANGVRIYPLGGIAQKTTVYCNESGEWAVYESDNYGFNNPTDLHSESSHVVLIGDSFTHGACVWAEQTVAANLRRLGLSSLSLGMDSSGPLLELAILTEYAQLNRPKILLWLYYEGNDLETIADELQSPILTQYLEADFSQGLANRQEEIDRVLTDYVTKSMTLAEQGHEATTLSRIFSIVRLYHLRVMIASVLRSEPALDLSPIFKNILSIANKRVASWGGEMYLVYLPAWDTFSDGVDDNDKYGYESFLAIIEDLEIPLIDFREVLEQHLDPLGLFPYRRSGHYTAKGYELLSSVIYDRLATDGRAQTDARADHD